MIRWLGILGFVSLCICELACKRTATPPPPPRQARAAPPPPRRVQLPEGMKLYPEEVLLQGGSFLMGSPDDEEFRLSSEGPRHKVHLNQVFTLWRYEVTQDEFQRVMGYNPSFFKKCGGRCPVERINWHEAANFCNRLSQKRGLPPCFRCSGWGRHVICRPLPRHEGRSYYRCAGFRLPTEAEWEYAARAGASGPLYKPVGKKTNILDAVINRIAWYADNSQVTYKGAFSCAIPPQLITPQKGDQPLPPADTGKCGTHPVGQKQPNRFGLYDMLGNVSEWIFDRFGQYKALAVTDPVGPRQGARIYRGCNWFQMQQECRLARRFWGSPSIRNQTLGFRPARSLGTFTIPK